MGGQLIRYILATIANNSVRIERRSDLNESDLVGVYCIIIIIDMVVLRRKQNTENIELNRVFNIRHADLELRLKLGQYPAIHTSYIISQSTTL